MTPDYAAVLTVLYPDALWGLNDNDYASLSWDESNTVGKPTKKTLDAAWPQVDYDQQYAAVEQQRRTEYQAQTDGMYFHAIRHHEALDSWEDAVAAVKAANPYPVKR